MSVVLIILFGIVAILLLDIIFIKAYTETETEQPVTAGSVQSMQTIKYSPGNFIDEKDIKIYDDEIIIKIKNASLSKYKSSGSMAPVFNIGANGIIIQPESEDQINVGDITTFEKNNRLIVHRVIKKSTDKQGTYFITKGDNNNFNDPKIRFSDIKYITIAIIY